MCVNDQMFSEILKFSILIHCLEVRVNILYCLQKMCICRKVGRKKLWEIYKCFGCQHNQ